MPPFTCPHCGSHAYSVRLSGCTVTNATLEESYSWDDAGQQYTSSGTILVESDDLVPQETQAICSGCEKDVTAPVADYETSLEEAAGA